MEQQILRKGYSWERFPWYILQTTINLSCKETCTENSGFDANA